MGGGIRGIKAFKEGVYGLPEFFQGRAGPEAQDGPFMFLAMNADTALLSVRVSIVLRIRPVRLQVKPLKRMPVDLAELRDGPEVGRLVQDPAVLEHSARFSDCVRQSNGGKVIYMLLEVLLCAMNDVELKKGMSLNDEVSIDVGCTSVYP